MTKLEILEFIENKAEELLIQRKIHINYDQNKGFYITKTNGIITEFENEIQNFVKFVSELPYNKAIQKKQKKKAEIEIVLKELPKVSLNKWYSGMHWSARKKQKDLYILLVKSQFKHVFSKDKKYIVSYTFYFNSRPLDASNTVSMIKMIEDIIFEDDKWNIIDIGGIKSRISKTKFDYVKIIINEKTH